MRGAGAALADACSGSSYTGHTDGGGGGVDTSSGSGIRGGGGVAAVTMAAAAAAAAPTASGGGGASGGRGGGASAGAPASAHAAASGSVSDVLGPKAYLARLLMASMTAEQVTYDRERVARAATSASMRAKLLADGQRPDVGNGAGNGGGNDNNGGGGSADGDDEDDDAMLRLIEAHLRRARVSSALQVLQTVVCTAAAKGAPASADSALGRWLIKLATAHTAAWTVLLTEADPATADMILRACSTAASLQERLFSVFEDGGLALQRQLLEKAEDMSKHAWHAVVARLGAVMPPNS